MARKTLDERFQDLIQNRQPNRRIELDSPFLRGNGALVQAVAGTWPTLWIGMSSALMMADYMPEVHVPLMRPSKGSPNYWSFHVLRLAELLQRIILMDSQGFHEGLGELMHVHERLKDWGPIDDLEVRDYFGPDFRLKLTGARINNAFGDRNGSFGIQLLWVIGCAAVCWTRTGYMLMGPEAVSELDPDTLEYNPQFMAFAERVFQGLTPLVMAVAGASGLRFPGSYAELTTAIEAVWDEHAVPGVDPREPQDYYRDRVNLKFGPRGVTRYIMESDVRHRSLTREWAAIADGVLGVKRRVAAGRQEAWVQQDGRELFEIALADQRYRLARLSERWLRTPLYLATR